MFRRHRWLKRWGVLGWVVAGVGFLRPLPGAGATPATLAAESRQGCPGTEVRVPVRLLGAPNLGTLQFSVHWDPAVATLLAVESIGLDGFAYPENFGGNATAGTLAVSWDDPSLAGARLSEDQTLFELHLMLTGAPGAGTAIAIDGTPVPVELTDAALAVLEVRIEAGLVEICGIPRAVYVDAGYVDVPDGARVDWPDTGGIGDHVIGCDAFATIEAAIGAVAAGGTVRVAEGTSSSQPLRLSDVTVVLDGAATGGTDVVVTGGGVLKGDGAVGDLAIESGGTVSPGYSPGTIRAGDTLWAGGGAYLWEVNAATGAAGSDPGWDRLEVAGTLAVTATAASPFTVKVTSLTPGNAAGLAASFRCDQAYTWCIARAAGGITAFAPEGLRLDTTGFVNPVAGGTFSLVIAGNDLDLRFTPSSPAVVSLLSFSAVWSAPGRVAVRWRTAEERNVIGFFVERLARDGTWQRVSADLIPAQGGAGQNEYLVEIALAVLDSPRKYRLVCVNLHGRREELAETFAEPLLTARVQPENGQVQIEVYGATGSTVRVQSTTEIFPGRWSNAGWIGLDEVGTGRWSIMPGPCEPKRFYRVWQEASNPARPAAHPP